MRIQINTGIKIEKLLNFNCNQNEPLFFRTHTTLYAFHGPGQEVDWEAEQTEPHADWRIVKEKQPADIQREQRIDTSDNVLERPDDAKDKDRSVRYKQRPRSTINSKQNCQSKYQHRIRLSRRQVRHDPVEPHEQDDTGVVDHSVPRNPH